MNFGLQSLASGRLRASHGGRALTEQRKSKERGRIKEARRRRKVKYLVHVANEGWKFQPERVEEEERDGKDEQPAKSLLKVRRRLLLHVVRSQVMRPDAVDVAS